MDPVFSHSGKSKKMCHLIHILHTLVVSATGKSIRAPYIHLSPISRTIFSGLTSHFFLNLQSLSAPSFSATLLPPLLSPPTQKQIHCLSFYVCVLHHFSDVLMLCPLWIVYWVLGIQEITSMRIFLMHQAQV